MSNSNDIKQIVKKCSDMEEDLVSFSSSEASVDLEQSDKKIIFSEDVVQDMIDAQNDTLMFGNNKGFFIFGKEISPGIVVFFKTTKNHFTIEKGSFAVTEEFNTLCMNLNIEIRNVKDIERLKNKGIKISTLAQGIPVGAELDYMDDGTIKLALDMRKQL